MSEFHPFTLAAAVKVLEAEYDTHDKVDTLVFGWGRDDLLGGSTIRRKFLDLARIAGKMKFTARTDSGDVSLARAIVDEAIKVAPKPRSNQDSWRQFVAGLRFDGFELVENDAEPDEPPSMLSRKKTVITLARMLPDDIPQLDFREAENEVERLLKRYYFGDAIGHLRQATNAFQRGDWAASNAQLRTFFQDVLDSIAENLGCEVNQTDNVKRQYLAGKNSGPFLIQEYNEWQNDRGNPSFIQGLWARLHPHGSHPGLSEEDDAAFRLQITLITVRLLMRRFDERKTAA